MFQIKFQLLFSFLFFSLIFYVSKVNSVVVIPTTIVVNVNGGADFTSIQKAIDSIPDNHPQWTKVHIAAGVYKEKVNISSTKTNILLEGEGDQTTSIEWGDYYNDAGGHNTLTSATFTSAASNLVATGIAFKNTFNDLSNMVQALAVSLLGSKNVFYKCSFIGLQDTLYDGFGLHYFKECHIEGYMDFIFGNGQSIYESCTISTIQGAVGPGYITAHERTGPEDPSGFVFKGCTILGSQAVFLGRPWNSYARVIYYQTNMASIIIPQGWDPWNSGAQEGVITFVEFNCVGPGSNLAQRVKWEKTFTLEEVMPFVNISYINKDGWLDVLPIIL